MQVQLTPEQHQGLRRLSTETCRSLADLVREGVDLYLGSTQRPDQKELWERALSIVGKYSSGLTDVGQNHDRYLAEDFDT